MTDEETSVPEGAAVFPQIPPELGVNPLLLTAIHAIVFLAGSDQEVVNQAAAEEAVGFMTEYLARLHGEALRQVREDMDCIVTYARQQKWPKQTISALKELLKDCGIDGEEDA